MPDDIKKETEFQDPVDTKVKTGAEEKEDLEEKTKKQKRKIRSRNILIIALIVVIILLLLAKCSTTPDNPITNFFNTTVDQNADDPDAFDKDAEQDRLNKKLEEGYLTFSVNKVPVFQDGKSKGNLNIINLEENNHPQVVEIYMLETDADGNDVLGERIYQSGMIPVGKAVKEAALDVELAKGEYHVMAVIYSVDENTGEMIGAVQTPLDITIMK